MLAAARRRSIAFAKAGKPAIQGSGRRCSAGGFSARRRWASGWWQAQRGPLTVGVSWSNFQEERWRADEAAIRATLTRLGAQYLSADAQAIQPAIRRAQAEGVPVVAYDRLIEVLKLKPGLDSGAIHIVGEQYTDGWRPEVAQRNMEQILTAQNNAVDAVLAAIAALTAQGMAGRVLGARAAEIAVAMAGGTRGARHDDARRDARHP